jgi:2-oxoglutarate dehydrogenase E2 component (dihydrolipoamide succinyltransferase)
MSTVDLKMPKMGESITEGTIINWMVTEGDAFEEGDILLEVATDKVDNEVPAPCAGIMGEMLFQAKDVVACGEVIAIFEGSEGGVSTSENNISESTNKQEVKKTPKLKTRKVESPQAFTQASGNTFFSPLIQSIAKAEHISFEELARIPATGTDARLRKSDIFNYIEEGRPFKYAQPIAGPDPTAYRIPQVNLDKGVGRIVEMDRMRQMIADRMVYSKHTSPHVTAYIEADLTELVEWRNKNKVAFQEKHGERLTFTPLFVQAVAKAVVDFPMINVTVDGTNIIVKENVNIGMATALPSGNLIVPVVKNADKKDLVALAADVNCLAAKARENKLGGDDIKGGTFTISNVGTFGSIMGTPIINQPEVAILAMGIIKKRAEVITTDAGDEIAIRSMMHLSLSFDHRVVDGYLGGSFLRKIGDYLEQFDHTQGI